MVPMADRKCFHIQILFKTCQSLEFGSFFYSNWDKSLEKCFEMQNWSLKRCLGQNNSKNVIKYFLVHLEIAKLHCWCKFSQILGLVGSMSNQSGNLATFGYCYMFYLNIYEGNIY